jgi:hypothetical protein
VAATREKISDALGWIRGLPGRARSALGDLGGVLAAAGRSLIRGFIDGIKSMVGSVRDAASDVVGAARDFFPFSPAKKGPFSGTGYTTHSGRALMKGFMEGIQSQLPALQSTFNGLADGMPDMGMGGFAPGTPGATAGGSGHTGATYNNTYQYHLTNQPVTMRDLEALQRIQETRARVGRPR